MTRLGAGIVVAALAATGAIGAVAAAPATAAPPTVSAALAISGERRGYGRVHLDHAITVESEKGEPKYTATFQGPGEFQAIILRSESVSSDGNAYSLLVQRDTLGGEAGSGSESTLDDARALPAGDYRVYLIFDKGPATARLKFSAGPEVSVAPEAPVNAKVGRLPNRPSSKANVEVVGDSGTIDSFGHLFFLSQFSFDLATGSVENCFYPEGDAQAGPDAYGPGCPGGVSDGVEDGLLPGTVGGGDFSGDSGPTSFGYGMNATYTGLPPGIDILGVWISYGDEPASARRTVPWLDLARDVLAVRRGRAEVPVSCRARSRCRGRLRISPGGKSRKVEVPARATRTFRVALAHRLVRAVAAHGSARATVRLSGVVAGSRRSDSRRVTLRRR
jgi:hypothetical protein